eukprot:Trichotokara_eunicae@DN3411_c0_g1_i1.p1
MSPKEDDLYLYGYGREWGENSTFTVGLSYGTGLLSGSILGLLIAKGQGGGVGNKIAFNKILNNVTRYGPRWANSAGSISLLFCGMKGITNRLPLFKRESLSSAFVGGIAGGLHHIQSPLRRQAMVAMASAGVFGTADEILRRGWI